MTRHGLVKKTRNTTRTVCDELSNETNETTYYYTNPLASSPLTGIVELIINCR